MTTSTDASTTTDPVIKESQFLPYPCSIVVLKANGKDGATFHFSDVRQWCAIGSHAECDIRVKASDVPLIHAIVLATPAGVMLYGCSGSVAVVVPCVDGEDCIGEDGSVDEVGGGTRSLLKDDHLLLPVAVNREFVLGSRRFRLEFPRASVYSTTPKNVNSATTNLNATPSRTTRSARKRRSSIVVTETDETFVPVTPDPNAALLHLIPDKSVFASPPLMVVSSPYRSGAGTGATPAGKPPRTPRTPRTATRSALALQVPSNTDAQNPDTALPKTAKGMPLITHVVINDLPSNSSHRQLSPRQLAIATRMAAGEPAHAHMSASDGGNGDASAVNGTPRTPKKKASVSSDGAKKTEDVGNTKSSSNSKPNSNPDSQQADTLSAAPAPTTATTSSSSTAVVDAAAEATTPATASAAVATAVTAAATGGAAVSLSSPSPKRTTTAPILRTPQAQQQPRPTKSKSNLNTEGAPVLHSAPQTPKDHRRKLMFPTGMADDGPKSARPPRTAPLLSAAIVQPSSALRQPNKKFQAMSKHERSSLKYERMSSGLPATPRQGERLQPTVKTPTRTKTPSRTPGRPPATTTSSRQTSSRRSVHPFSSSTSSPPPPSSSPVSRKRDATVAATSENDREKEKDKDTSTSAEMSVDKDLQASLGGDSVGHKDSDSTTPSGAASGSTEPREFQDEENISRQLEDELAQEGDVENIGGGLDLELDLAQDVTVSTSAQEELVSAVVADTDANGDTPVEDEKKVAEQAVAMDVDTCTSRAVVSAQSPPADDAVVEAGEAKESMTASFDPRDMSTDKSVAELETNANDAVNDSADAAVLPSEKNATGVESDVNESGVSESVEQEEQNRTDGDIDMGDTEVAADPKAALNFDETENGDTNDEEMAEGPHNESSETTTLATDFENAGDTEDQAIDELPTEAASSQPEEMKEDADPVEHTAPEVEDEEACDTCPPADVEEESRVDQVPEETGMAADEQEDGSEEREVVDDEKEMLEKEQTEEIHQEVEKYENVDTSKQVSAQDGIAASPSVLPVGEEDDVEETTQVDHDTTEPTLEAGAHESTEVQSSTLEKETPGNDAETPSEEVEFASVSLKTAATVDKKQAKEVRKDPDDIDPSKSLVATRVGELENRIHSNSEEPTRPSGERFVQLRGVFDGPAVTESVEQASGDDSAIVQEERAEVEVTVTEELDTTVGAATKQENEEQVTSEVDDCDAPTPTTTTDAAAAEDSAMADDSKNQIVEPAVAVVGDSVDVVDDTPVEQATVQGVVEAYTELVEKTVDETMQEMADVAALESGRAVILQQDEEGELEDSTAPEVDERKETVSEPQEPAVVDTMMECAEVTVDTEEASGVSLSHHQSEETEVADMDAAAETAVDGDGDGDGDSDHMDVDDSSETAEHSTLDEGIDDTVTQGTPEEEEKSLQTAVEQTQDSTVADKAIFAVAEAAEQEQEQEQQNDEENIEPTTEEQNVAAPIAVGTADGEESSNVSKIGTINGSDDHAVESAGKDMGDAAADITVAEPSEGVADISENGNGTSKELETDTASCIARELQTDLSMGGVQTVPENIAVDGTTSTQQPAEQTQVDVTVRTTIDETDSAAVDDSSIDMAVLKESDDHPIEQAEVQTIATQDQPSNTVPEPEQELQPTIDTSDSNIPSEQQEEQQHTMTVGTETEAQIDDNTPQLVSEHPSLMTDDRQPDQQTQSEPSIVTAAIENIASPKETETDQGQSDTVDIEIDNNDDGMPVERLVSEDPIMRPDTTDKVDDETLDDVPEENPKENQAVNDAEDIVEENDDEEQSTCVDKSADVEEKTQDDEAGDKHGGDIDVEENNVDQASADVNEDNSEDVAKGLESADQALEDDEEDNDYEPEHDEDAEEDEDEDEDEDEGDGEDEEAGQDDDLEQESKDLLADAELHESEKTASPTVNNDSKAFTAVEKGLDEKENEDPQQEDREAEMKDDDENETVIEGDADGEDDNTAMDESAMDDVAKKTLEQTQLDAVAIAQDEQREVDKVAEAISALAVVPDHDNPQEHGDDVVMTWSEDSLHKMKVKELQVLLKDRSLSTSGKKADLINRLLEYKQQLESVSSTVPTSDDVTASEPQQDVEEAQEQEQVTTDEQQPASASEALGEAVDEVKPEAAESEEHAPADIELEAAAEQGLDKTKDETEAQQPDEEQDVPSEKQHTNDDADVDNDDEEKAGDGDSQWTAEELEKLRVKDLQLLLKERGLQTAGKKREIIARLLTHAGQSDNADKYLSDDVPATPAKSSGVSVAMMSATRRSTRLTKSARAVNDADDGDGDVSMAGEKDENSHHNVAVKLDMNVDDDDGDEKDGENMKEETAEEKEEHTAESLKKFTVRELREMFSSTGTEAPGNGARKDDIIALLLQALSDAKDGSNNNKVDSAAAAVDADDMDETSSSVEIDAEPSSKPSDDEPAAVQAGDHSGGENGDGSDKDSDDDGNEDENEEALRKLTVKQLRQKLVDRDEEVTGKMRKDDLIERLMALSINDKGEGEGEEEEGGEQEQEQEEESVPLSKLTKKELHERLAELSLPNQGNKAVLVQRLQQAIDGVPSSDGKDEGMARRTRTRSAV